MSGSSKSSNDDWLSSSPVSSGGGNKKNSGNISWTVFFTILTYIITVIFFSPSWVEKEINQEMKNSQFWLGEKSATMLSDNSIGIYKNYIIDSGIQKMVKQSTDINVLSTRSKNAFSLKMEEMIKNIGETTLLIIYQSIYRAQTILFWIPIFIPFLIAWIIEAITIRKVKQFTFGWSSANKFHLMKGAIIAIIPLMLVLYLSVPIALPVIMPLMILLLLGISTNILISNLQKVF